MARSNVHLATTVLVKFLRKYRVLLGHILQSTGLLYVLFVVLANTPLPQVLPPPTAVFPAMQGHTEWMLEVTVRRAALNVVLANTPLPKVLPPTSVKTAMQGHTEWMLGVTLRRAALDALLANTPTLLGTRNAKTAPPTNPMPYTLA